MVEWFEGRLGGQDYRVEASCRIAPEHLIEVGGLLPINAACPAGEVDTY
jgi:hypothetical protein